MRGVDGELDQKTLDADHPNRDWAQLVQMLKDQLPALTDDFMKRVNSIPAYSRDTVSLQDLRNTATESLSIVVGCLADSSKTAEMDEYARELGRRRVSQGVPAEDLMSAVRLNFPVIWAALLRLAGTGQDSLLASRVEFVWRVLDNYAVACCASYLTARVAAAREDMRIRQEFIASLFADQGQLLETRERFADAFGVPTDVPYSVLAVNGGSTEAVREAALGRKRFLHESVSHSFLFWPLDRGKRSYELSERLLGERGGLAISAEGLGGLATAAKRAAALAEASSNADVGPLTIEQHWPRLARKLLRTSHVDLSDALDTALSRARPGEAERLRETVLDFLNTGSVSETAEHLFAHRNTIFSRLRRFTDLTGIDLSVPSEAAKVVVSWLG